jgi:hypothetical protein
VSKKPRPPRPERARRLILGALRDFRADWKLYFKILAVVSVPFNLLTVLGFASVDIQTLTYYGSFATVIMNVALLWAIIASAKGERVTMPAAYYRGMGQLVSYILTTAALVCMLIPLALGVTLYSAAATPNTGTTPGEVALVGVLSLIVALPSLYLIVRYGLSLLLVMTDGLRPIAALRRARLLTLGRFWPLTGRFLLLVVFLVILAIPAALITTGLELLQAQAWGIAFFQVAITLTLLPLAYLYGLRLLRSLESDGPDTPGTPG